MVEEYFKDGSDFGFHASYAYEETLLGTAGAIKNAGKFITEDRFYVLNADTFTRSTIHVWQSSRTIRTWIWLWFCARCRMYPVMAKQFR